MRGDQESLAVDSINPDAGEWREEEECDLACEEHVAHVAFGQLGMRTGLCKTVDEPGGGDLGDERAYKRDQLAAEEKAIVARGEGPRHVAEEGDVVRG